MLSPDAHLFGALREFFQQYGYWTIAGMLLVENAGVPAPGEATLLFASVLASYEHPLRLPLIIVVAMAASVLGDNVGYAVGYFGGKPLLDKYKGRKVLCRARCAVDFRGKVHRWAKDRSRTISGCAANAVAKIPAV